MKKYILLLLSIAICTTTMNLVSAKTTTNSDLASAIKMYKAGNYSQCYEVLNKIIKNDPSNAVAYYYKAITAAQIGKKEEAIENYDKAISLSPDNQVGRYAQKGKTCLESPDNCSDETDQASELDAFVQSKFGSGFSDAARSDYENQKIKNIMREMNRGADINPGKFKEYKDFSSMNMDETPTNEEIVAAFRVLQNAGFGNLLNNNNMSDLSLLTGAQNNNAMINMLLGGNMNNTSVSPQVIQSILTNQLSTGF